MGLSSNRVRDVEEEAEEALLPTKQQQQQHQQQIQIPPKDSFHFAYIVFFTLGAGYLLPWNAFITAVDYFGYLYPEVSVDRVFALVYMTIGLLFLLLIIAYSYSYRSSSSNTSSSSSSLRINVGLLLFMVSMLVVPLLDSFYIRGRTGLYPGFYVTVATVALSGVADAMVQSGVIGSAGELPERYMQAVIAGTAASGVLVSVLRIITKSMFPQDAHGLRSSANLYFIVGIVTMAICLVFHNVADRLPIIKYYKDLKTQAALNKETIGANFAWKTTLSDILSRVKWYGLSIILIYIVTLSIFPGYITEDVHSQTLKDWYPILLITCFNVFDLVGKCLTAFYLLEDMKVAVGACVARLLFYPLFLGCLHGPEFFRTEIPVIVLTCLLGLTNGYLTSVLMIVAPKAVQIQHAGTAGVLMVLFLVVGLASGSVVAWFWVI